MDVLDYNLEEGAGRNDFLDELWRVVTHITKYERRLSGTGLADLQASWFLQDFLEDNEDLVIDYALVWQEKKRRRMWSR